MGSAEEIPTGGSKVVTIGITEIVVFNLSGEFYALCNQCPHGGFRFSNGPLEGDVVICPGHMWEFNVKTGQCMNMDYEPAQTYRVLVESNDIFIEFKP